MSRRILVLCAMEDERPPVEPNPRYDVVVSGVGKLNAALAVAKWHSQQPESAGIVIVLGSAGAIVPERPGTFVIASDARQHDVDASALGFTKGDVPFAQRQVYPASSFLAGKALEAIRACKVPFSIGRYLSGDRFVATSKDAEDLRKRFEGACVDFETAAIAQACWMYQYGWIAIKFITDGANEKSPKDFKENLTRYRESTHNIVKHMVDGLYQAWK